MTTNMTWHSYELCDWAETSHFLLIHVASGFIFKVNTVGYTCGLVAASTGGTEFNSIQFNSKSFM